MKIIVNKKELVLDEGFFLDDLLRQMGLSKIVAIWINDEQLLMGEYDKRILKDGDQVRIIRPLGGG